MLSPFLFPLSGLTSIANRVRGEGAMPRWCWYTIMALIASGTFLSAHTGMTLGSLEGITVIWALYFIGYALMPWQAMFSAVNGQAPSRKDGWYAQWMQTASMAMTPNYSSGIPNYYAFGIIYGAIRALLMLPSVFMFCHFTGSGIPAIGAMCLLMGVVYYYCERFSRHCGMGNAMGVPFAELTMGWWNGVYILIVAASV